MSFFAHFASLRFSKLPLQSEAPILATHTADAPGPNSKTSFATFASLRLIPFLAVANA